LNFNYTILRLLNSVAINTPTRSFSLWVLLLLVLPQLSWAAAPSTGTPSNTTIANQASVDYVVGTTPSTTAVSNIVQFVVDKKIDFVVVETAGQATTVNAGQLNAVTTFTVTNMGNDAQGYNLAAAVASGNPAIGATAPSPFTTNDFSVTNFRVFVDAVDINGIGDGIYNPLVDTATFIGTLSAGATSPIIFIVSDVPAPLNGQQSVVSLTATVTPVAVDPTPLPTPAVALTAADTANGVEVVYADRAGIIDVARDGKHSAYSAYVAGAVVAISKTIVNVHPTSGVDVASPTNGDAAVRPGSIITYQILASFTGAGTLDALTISDPLPAETTYLPNSITVDGVAKTDSATDTDNADFTANIITVKRQSVTAPTADVVIQFKATIN
jgi:uncharacterized repeat protein (TIGR01451 family)